MSHFRRAWGESKLYKEYLFGFETLVFGTLGISSMHGQHVTLQRERKLEIASYDPFKTCHDVDNKWNRFSYKLGQKKSKSNQKVSEYIT